ncbi:hypothetical protein [Photobacterium sanctipauli]|nr:hypothetical protein [Photobacterium sanctipauli]
MVNKSNVLVFGGLGDPQSAVVGLYRDLLSKLQDNYQLIAVDPSLAQLDISHHAKQLGIEYDGYFANLTDFGCSPLASTPIQAVLILTPVTTHLAIVRQVAKLALADDALMVIEKPSFALDEVSQGFDQDIEQLKRQGLRFYFIDTALVSPALEYVFDHQLISAAVPPHKIIAHATDNPLAKYAYFPSFSFEQKLTAINQRGLVNLSKNGGAGIGLDMGIHAVAGLMRLLDETDFGYRNIQIDQLRLEALDHPDLERYPGAETHLFVHGKLECQHQAIPFNLIGGKGGDIWDRRLELHYSDKIISIGFGTLKHYPYVHIQQGNEATWRTFPLTTAGYPQHFADILCLLELGGEDTLTISCQQSERLMKNAMKLFEATYYHAGKAHDVREQAIYKVNEHLPRFLTKDEIHHRSRLDSFMKKHCEIGQ